MNVTEICEAWVKDGRANECFWEGWPGQPKCDRLTPNMVLEALRAEREKALREAAATVTAGDTVQAIQRKILALIQKG